MKTVAKKAPSKALLPTLCDMWRGLGMGSPNMVCIFNCLCCKEKLTRFAFSQGAVVVYFDLFKRSLRSAPRAAVQENLRAIFSVFLDAFSVTKGTQVKDAAVSFSDNKSLCDGTHCLL